MSTLIENVSILLGSEFEVINKGYVEVHNGQITHAGEEPPHSKSEGTALNGSGLLAIPGLIDAHTHIADSIAKDAGIGSSLDELVHPIYGLKGRLLNNAPDAQLREAMATTAHDMLASGITTFADFREGALKGVKLALSALEGSKSRAVILGRPNYHFHPNDVTAESRPLGREAIEELAETIELAGGLGVSGANEYTDRAMEQISDLVRGKDKLLAVHASESVESNKFSMENFSESEVKRILRFLKPTLLIHLTNANPDDLRMVAESKLPVVCCPRANSVLGLGFPPILELLEAGVTVALGTDNVMLAAPDMFREMDYASRVIRSEKRRAAAISSNDVLKMATVNAAKALGLGSKIGCIEKGKRGDLVFLDLNSTNLRFSKDLVASVVHRAKSTDVKCVMVGGEMVHGSINKS
jgi:cytosine/adenosine deaminase-related metal-dependent hydrolase